MGTIDVVHRAGVEVRRRRRIRDAVGEVSAEACPLDHLGEELVEETRAGAILQARESARDVCLTDLDGHISHGPTMLPWASRTGPWRSGATPGVAPVRLVEREVWREEGDRIRGIDARVQGLSA